MVHLGLEISLNEAKEKVVASLENGNALDKFYELIKYQGGDIDKLPKTKYKYEVYSTINGFLTNIDAYMLGEFCKIIGAGREKLNDIIDYSVGIVINKKSTITLIPMTHYVQYIVIKSLHHLKMS